LAKIEIYRKPELQSIFTNNNFLATIQLHLDSCQPTTVTFNGKPGESLFDGISKVGSAYSTF
jgi:hypothetical protein